MKSLVVFTAIIDSYEQPKPLPALFVPPLGCDTRYVLFTNSHGPFLRGWEVRHLAYSHADPRRAARWHKVMGPNVLFLDADYTLWHDGSHVLTVNPWDLVEQYQQYNVDFASFRHPQRFCVYDEIRACVDLKKDDPKVLHRVANHYREAGFPRHAGLFETACVIRRGGIEAVRRLNKLWWKEIELGSVRDQVSLPYVLWKLQQENLPLTTTYIEGCRDRSPYFSYTPHRRH